MPSLSLDAQPAKGRSLKFGVEMSKFTVDISASDVQLSRTR